MIPAYIDNEDGDEEEMTYVMSNLISSWDIAERPYRLYAWVGGVKYVLVANNDNLKEALPIMFDFEWNQYGEAVIGGRSGSF